VTGSGSGGGPPIHIAIAYPGFDEETLATFRAVSPRLVFDITPRYGLGAADEIVTPATDGLIGFSLPTDLSRAPNLRWLQILSAGAEFALDALGGAWPAGITFTNARGCYAGAIAQFTLAAILRVAEQVDARTELQRGGVWPDDNDQFIGKLLRGQTLVIVGYGGIGREIARLAAAFGMRIIAVKARPEQREDTAFRLPGTGDPDGTIPERIVGVDGLGDAFAEADFVSITLPISPGSRGVVSRSVLERLRPHAWLINTGRGPVTDEVALAELLAAGRIGGAALDVFGEEPLPSDSPFWTLPNVVLTPHISGSSGALEHRHLIAENLRRFVAGEPLLNQVDVVRGY
jgi:phosphoglycerate dehydrogenase-like enzyme